MYVTTHLAYKGYKKNGVHDPELDLVRPFKEGLSSGIAYAI